MDNRLAARREADLEALLARAAIREVLASFARGADRADGDLLRSCYHADAIEDHAGSFVGRAHEYVDLAVPRLRASGVTQHFLGSSHIELQGDVAHVETCILTFVRLAHDGQKIDSFTGARLLDRFERRADEWKIAHRRIVLDWNRDTPTREGWCMGRFDPDRPGVLRGRKDAADPSYERA
jgi:ketosteroid isomerase-like protein